MAVADFDAIVALLASTNPDEIAHGLGLVRSQVPDLTEADVRSLYEMISALFYIDPLDLPTHVPVLEEAISLVASFGPPVIPMLIQNLEMSDVKAQMAVAQALGHIGAEAVGPLIAEYHVACPEPGCRAFIMYALGKISSPEVAAAIPAALKAAASPNVEERDSATRALGKFSEAIAPGQISPQMRSAMVAALRANLADPDPGIRAKAVRSLGKLARHKHLTRDERGQLRLTLQRLLGEDEQFDWDRAYVVRKEAKEAIGYV